SPVHQGDEVEQRCVVYDDGLPREIGSHFKDDTTLTLLSVPRGLCKKTWHEAVLVEGREKRFIDLPERASGELTFLCNGNEPLDAGTFCRVVFEVIVNYIKNVGSERAHEFADASKKLRYRFDLQPLAPEARKHEFVVRSFNQCRKRSHS